MADVSTLKTWLSISDDVADEELLEEVLEAARVRIEDRVLASAIGSAPVEQAIVLYAARLYNRRHTPEGVVLMGDSGSRVPNVDYDVEALISRYLKWGFA